jgi:clan AA aspartic protease (TIGR02281 family)
MYKFGSIARNYRWLGIMCLAISITACNSGKIGSQSPEPSPAPVSVVPAPAPVQPTPPPVVPQDRGEVYQQALNKADAASAIGQSAISKDDWLLVSHNLQESVHMLKSIEPNTAQYILAVKVLPKYEQQLASARQKAVNFINKSAQNTAIAQPVAALPQRENFSLPIQEKLGGVPVIEVTMNNQKVSMLLDTGASHTLITKSVAKRLKIEITGISQAETANGTATFDVGTIDQVKFGSGQVEDLRVSIGQDDLPYGLLGHDVYDGYDITIKENSIEFRKR